MFAPVNSPPVESIPLLWRGVKLCLTGWLWRVCTSQFPSCGGEMSSTDTLGRLHRVLHTAAPLDGVVASCLHQSIPLLWSQFPSCGGEMSSTDILGRLHRVLHTAALLDGVVVACLHQSIPLRWRGVKLRLTGWLHHVYTG